MSPYEPGTVAVATVRGVEGVRIFLADPRSADEWTSAGLVDGTLWHKDKDVTDVRPLVVLDPDDVAADGFSTVASLVTNLRRPPSGANFSWLADQIEAQTKPPRIPEPGLWGVVEATFRDGRSRHGWAVRRLTDGDADWQDGAGDYHQWDDLIDPILVREGVTE